MSGFRHIITGNTPEFYREKMARRGDKSPRLNMRIATGPDRGNTVKRPDPRILSILVGLANSFGKTYCIPSQEKILELLWKFHRARMSRRTLNRHLRSMEQQQMLIRTRRHKRDRHSARGWLMRSTLYTPLFQQCWRMAREAGSLCRLLKNAMKSGAYREGSRVPNMALYLRRSLNLLIPEGGNSSPSGG